jgi:hypothetical protein
MLRKVALEPIRSKSNNPDKTKISAQRYELRSREGKHRPHWETLTRIRMALARTHPET